MEGEIVAVGIESLVRERLDEQVAVLASQYLLTRKQHDQFWSVSGNSGWGVNRTLINIQASPIKRGGHAPERADCRARMPASQSFPLAPNEVGGVYCASRPTERYFRYFLSWQFSIART